MKEIGILRTASGEEVAAVVQRLEGALAGTSKTLALMGMFNLCVILMHPAIGEDQLTEVVMQSSEHLCQLLSALDQPLVVN